MSLHDAFYKEKLYPLQDGILKLVSELDTPLYLTGGTALSRAYFGHRYSDDLGLFVNCDPEFSRWVDLVFEGLEAEDVSGALTLVREASIRTPDFARLRVSAIGPSGIDLKVDLVNDSAPHFGLLALLPGLGRVDAVRNMLSNKLAAALRFAGKDMADLWIICKNRSFEWRAIWKEAQEKEAGLDPSMVAEVVAGVPLSELETIRWSDPQFRCPEILEDLKQISKDIIHGATNSLGVGKPSLEA